VELRVHPLSNVVRPVLIPATPGTHAYPGWAPACPRTSATMSRMGRFQWQPNLAWCRSAPSSRRWFSQPALARPCSSSSSRPPGLQTAAISWRGAPAHATIRCAAAARRRPQRTQRFGEPRRRVGDARPAALRSGCSALTGLCAPLGFASRTHRSPPQSRLQHGTPPKPHPHRVDTCTHTGRARSVATGSACEHSPKVSTTVVKLAGGKARTPAVNGLSAGSPSRGGAATCAAAGARAPASCARLPCGAASALGPQRRARAPPQGWRSLPQSFSAAGRWPCCAWPADGAGSAARPVKAEVHAACSASGFRRQCVIQGAFAYATLAGAGHRCSCMPPAQSVLCILARS